MMADAKNVRLQGLTAQSAGKRTQVVYGHVGAEDAFNAQTTEMMAAGWKFQGGIQIFDNGRRMVVLMVRI
jgi:hypothetical protein